MSDHHARRAFELLAQLPRMPHQLDGLELGSAATAHALLAVEARLSEIVEQLRVANVIGAVEVLRAAFLRGRASDADFDRALARVLELLKLPTEDS